MSYSFVASRLSALDKSVMVLTLCVWLAHFAITGTLFYFIPDYPNDIGTLLARAICSVLAAGLCLAIHLLLRQSRNVRPWLLLKALVITIPAAVVLTRLGGWIFYELSQYTRPGEWLRPGMLIADYVGYQWTFFAWGALYTGAAYAIEARRRDQQLAAAQSAAQQAQLLALRLQINPHFLFNTLNTLAGLIVLGRTAESETMVLNLSRFLRYTLSNTLTQYGTVDEEGKILRMYLDVEKTRFSGRLRIVYTIDAECSHALIPSLILLPLVENAIKHGLGDSEHGIAITISAKRQGEDLLLCVEDDGNGNGNARDGLGIGLSNVKQRLHALYGDGAGLQVSASTFGWRSAIRMPWLVAA